MTCRFAFAGSLAAALLANAPPRAASCKKDADCSSGQVCSNGTCVKRLSRAASDAASAVSPTESSTAGTKRTPYIGWGGLGLYNVGVTGGSSTYFGFHAGGAASLINLTPELPLIGWGDIALTLGGDLFFPMAVGARAPHHSLGPVQRVGGLRIALLA